MAIRIQLVEDQVILREGLRSLINQQSDMEVVGEASDGRQAVELALELRPEVVVMDVAMPGTNGIEATRQIVMDKTVAVYKLDTARRRHNEIARAAEKFRARDNKHRAQPFSAIQNGIPHNLNDLGRRIGPKR